MKKQQQLYLIMMLGIFLAFLLFIPLSVKVNAINYDKTSQEKAGVVLQVNGGAEETATSTLDIEVDRSGNSKVTMFSVVLCQDETDYCSDLDAAHRYNTWTGDTAKVSVPLSWISEANSKATITVGKYTVKVKPEYKDCLGILCSPVKDIIKDDNRENRFIKVTVSYAPLTIDDFNVQYNGVNLIGEGSTTIIAPKFAFAVRNGKEIYGVSYSKVSYQYCMASASWVASAKCGKGNLTLTDNYAAIDLTDKKLEGHYIMTAKFETNLVSDTKTVKFFYDDIAPRIAIDFNSSEIAKSHIAGISVVDNSNIVAKYAVLPYYVEEIKNTNVFTNTIGDTTVYVDGLTGDYRVWVYAEDSNGNYAVASSNIMHLDNSAPVIQDYEYYYDSHNSEIIVHIKEVEDQCDDNMIFYASADKENYVSSTSNYLRVPVKPDQHIIYMYVEDRLGNEGSEKPKAISVEFTAKEFAVTYPNPARDNYYHEMVVFNVPLAAKSIKINGSEYAHNLFVCTPGEENYRCVINSDGIYTIIISDGIINSTSTFILDKDGLFNIGGEDTNVDSIVLLPVQYDNGTYYGKLPLSIYDVTKDITLIYRKTDGTYAYLSTKTNNISIADIEDYNKFALDINISLYQNSNFSSDLNTPYFLAVVTSSSRSDNDIVVKNPVLPIDDRKDTPNNGEDVKYRSSFDWKGLFNLRNIVFVAIVMVVAFYLIRFFIFRKSN